MSSSNVKTEINNATTEGEQTVADFGSIGVKADVIAESTAATGVTIDSTLVKDGGVLCPGAATGLGYSTGAGGTVTQATSKSTGVTLSKLCGTITTHNAALAAAAEVTFIVTNTLVALTDVIVLSIQSGGTPGEYQATVSTVTAGTFHITLANLSAASASDAVAINFAVIKGVAA